MLALPKMFTIDTTIGIVKNQSNHKMRIIKNPVNHLFWKP